MEIQENDLIIYNTDDMMRILKFKQTKMNQLLNSGEFPAVKIGGQWRITRSKLEQWMEDNAGQEIYI